jgi:OmpA-OmpF porin, OOP family
MTSRADGTSSWRRFDRIAMAVLLGLLALLWLMWINGRGPGSGFAGCPMPGTPTAAVAPPVALPAAPKSLAAVDLQATNGGLRLGGRVDSEATKAALEQSATAAYGAGKVTNTLTVDANTTALAWQGRARDLMGEMKSWGDGATLRTDGGAMTLTGVVPTDAEKAARQSKLAGLIGSDVAIDNRIFVVAPPPLVPPPPKGAATVEAQKYDGNKLRLSGRVESEAAKGSLGDAAVAAFGSGNVTNGLIVDGSVGPVAWTARGRDVFGELKSVDQISALFSNGRTASVVGVAPSEAEKLVRSTRMQALIGAEVTVDNRIAVVAPPPPPAPPTPIKGPATIDIVKVDGKLNLAGRIESDAAKTALGEAAASAFGAANVANGLIVDGNVLPLAWSVRAKDLFAELKSTEQINGLFGSGRIASLAGVSPSEAEKLARGTRMQALVGNDVALDNRIAVVVPPPPPTPPPASIAPKMPSSVEVQKFDGKLLLTGRVENDVAREQLGDAAAAAFGAGNVMNSLTIDGGVSELPWIGRARAVMNELKGADQITGLVGNGRIATLVGVVPTTAEKAARGTRLQTALGSDATIDNRIAVVTPPAAAPAATPKLPLSVDMQSVDGRLRLSGRVDSAETRQAMVTAANTVYGSGNVTDALTVDAGVGVSMWPPASRDILTELKGWGSFGSMRADGLAVTLAGTVPSDTERLARGERARGLFGPDTAIDNRIVVAAAAPVLPPAATPVATPSLPVVCSTIASSAKIAFESSKATLTEEGGRALEQLVPCFATGTFEVIGHTDSSGDEGDNNRLSQSRAQAVVEYLGAKGAKAVLSATGAGSAKPIAPNDTAEGRAKNRRIEFKPL